MENIVLCQSAYLISYLAAYHQSRNKGSTTNKINQPKMYTYMYKDTNENTLHGKSGSDGCKKVSILYISYYSLELQGEFCLYMMLCSQRDLIVDIVFIMYSKQSPLLTPY